jgi:hypothetical protein
MCIQLEHKKLEHPIKHYDYILPPFLCFVYVMSTLIVKTDLYCNTVFMKTNVRKKMPDTLSEASDL